MEKGLGRDVFGGDRTLAISEAIIVRFATDNRDWGYDRIAGALANLGYAVSDQTVGNILKRHGIPPAPARKHTTTWKDFIRAHQEVLAATSPTTLPTICSARRP